MANDSSDEESRDDGNQGSIDGDPCDSSDAGSVALAENPKKSPNLVSSGDEQVAGTESDPGSHDSVLTATTLELGKERPPSTDSDDENQRDSQVSSGWLGRAYNRESRRLKSEKKLQHVAQVGSLENVGKYLKYFANMSPPKKGYETTPVKEIIGDLVRSNLDLVSHPAFGKYYDYCLTSLKNHGEHIAEKLVSREHYFRWKRFYGHKEIGPFMFDFSRFSKFNGYHSIRSNNF